MAEISIRDVYEAVSRLAGEVSEFRGEMRAHVALSDERTRLLGEKVDDHEERLRRMEKRVWVAAGSAVVAGGAVGSVAQQIIGGG